MRRIDMWLWFLKHKKLPVIMGLEQSGVQPKVIEITLKTIKKMVKLYYIIDKTKPTSDPFYKIALNKRLTGEEDF